MLNVPTLWVVFVVNFLALGLVWTYVMRSYPTFSAARFWMGCALLAALGSAISLTRGSVDPLVPILGAGFCMISAVCSGTMGIRRFYGKDIYWRDTILTIAVTVTGLALFSIAFDNMAMRILVYSLGQSLSLAMVLPLLFSRDNGRSSPGARLTGYITALIIVIHTARSAAAVAQLGGGLTLLDFNELQAGMIVALVFLSMAWNFGVLLMAIDRLRNEVADLALLDDLTGTANRRRLLARLDDECIRSERTRQTFSLLMIDLDGFKDINDSYGHAAGDECLRTFSRAVQSRLRTTDLLARLGGDEFCVVLPATTMREAAVVARHIVDACRETPAHINGTSIAMTASIGVAQWHKEVGLHPQRLLASGDEALYDAKKGGKNRYALENDAPLAKPTQRLTA